MQSLAQTWTTYLWNFSKSACPCVPDEGNVQGIHVLQNTSNKISVNIGQVSGFIYIKGPCQFDKKSPVQRCY